MIYWSTRAVLAEAEPAPLEGWTCSFVQSCSLIDGGDTFQDARELSLWWPLCDKNPLWVRSTLKCFGSCLEEPGDHPWVSLLLVVWCYRRGGVAGVGFLCPSGSWAVGYTQRQRRLLDSPTMRKRLSWNHWGREQGKQSPNLTFWPLQHSGNQENQLTSGWKCSSLCASSMQTQTLNSNRIYCNPIFAN